MDIEWLKATCLALPGTSEDIKWGNDLCFLVAEKMFCVTNLEPPLHVSFKVSDEEFEELSQRDGFIPAPYMARAKWVMVQQVSKLSKSAWKEYIQQSYNLVKAKLPKKTQLELDQKPKKKK
jgi:predicted DNA-binding protein (MmcQ/YjbR family)